MGPGSDENLPEVAPEQTPLPQSLFDPSPQALSPDEVNSIPRYFVAERDKYPALFDKSPKYPSEQIYRDSRQWANQDAQSALSPDVPMPWDSLPAGAGVNFDPEQDNFPGSRICRMRRGTFFLAIIFALAIIAAAVGGGVAGSAKAREDSQRADSRAPVETTSSRNNLPSSTTSVLTETLTLASIVGPTISFLNNQTNPAGLAFQGFSKPEYQGRSTPIIRAEGFYDLGFECNSYVWLPDATSCCVTFCANKTTATGWWCDQRYRANASGPIPRIYIWCNRGNNPGADNKCS